MTFEWDEVKNKTNKKKHGVSFEMAVRVFLDEKRIERLDLEHSTLEEERTSIIGRVSDFLIRAEGFIPRRLRRNKGDETRLRYLMRTTYLDACVEVC